MGVVKRGVMLLVLLLHQGGEWLPGGVGNRGAGGREGCTWGARTKGAGCVRQGLEGEHVEWGGGLGGGRQPSASRRGAVV